MANLGFDSSLFKEDDTTCFEPLLDFYYEMLFLFHGKISDLRERIPIMFDSVLYDFTQAFEKYYLFDEFARNLCYNLNFKGYFYCPIDKKHYLYTHHFINSIKENLPTPNAICHMGVIYEEFYIHSDIPNDLLANLYYYLIGCCDVNRDRRRTKVINYKRKGTFSKFTEDGSKVGG